MITALGPHSLSVIVARVSAIGPDHCGRDLQVPGNTFRLERFCGERALARAD